jgi:hypothetical protein
MIDRMDLLNGWVRQLLGAGTVAALVPVAVVASLAVILAGSGGVGGLGSLGQLVTGPQISPAQQLVAATPRAQATNGRDVALVAPPTLVADATAGRAQRPGTVRENAPAPVHPAPAPPPGRVEPLTPPVVKPTPRPVAPPPAAAPQPFGPPPPPPPTTADRTGKAVDGLGNAVDEVVDGVGEVIGGLGETLGGILDGPPPRR